MSSFDHEPSPEHFIPGSGGIVRDLQIHDIDTARWLTGLEVESVYATGAVRRWQRFARHGDLDTSVLVLTMNGGLPVVATGTRHDPRGYDVRLELLGSDDSMRSASARGRRSARSRTTRRARRRDVQRLPRPLRAGVRRRDAHLARGRPGPAREPVPGRRGAPRAAGRDRVQPLARGAPVVAVAEVDED